MPRTSLMMRGAAEELVREQEIIRGHAVGRGHCAQRADLVVGATAAHNADAAHRRQHGERLPAQPPASGSGISSSGIRSVSQAAMPP
jgi:hypothetical protein